MRSTKQMTVTRPLAMAEKVSARVEAGDYASEAKWSRRGCARFVRVNAPLKDGFAKT